MRAVYFGVICALALASPAVAQERSFKFALGGAVGVGPEYMGSDDYSVSALPTFTFGRLRWGALSTIDVREIPENGISFNGAFRILGERNADDSPELTGLEDIDYGVELGAGMKFQQTNWLAFGEVRKGVSGHSGLTGTIGADWIFRPNDRMQINAGPRINFGDDDYANTYFGISSSEASASSFDAYDADGGALSASIVVSGIYFIDDKWSLEGAVSYEKLMGGAADSPITLNGSEDQFRIGLGLNRIFELNF